MPKISICVPAYNVENYIEECINSILRQTFTDIEVIVVDDGSTDRTGQILDSIQDGRLQVLHTDNGGAVRARKLALSKAVGDYIGFVDADDYIADDMYEILYKKASESGAELTYNQAYFRDFNSDITVVRDSRLQTGFYSIEQNNMEYIYNHVFSEEKTGELAGGACWSLYKREIVYPLWTLLPEKVVIDEDVAFMALVAVNVKSIYIMEKPLYYYRCNLASVTHTIQPQFLSATQGKYELLASCFEKHEYASVLMRQLKSYTIRSLMTMRFLANATIAFYLFPYEKIPAGSRVILYGAGEVGVSCYNQIRLNHYCEIICWADIRFSELQEKGVVSPDVIPDMEYDYILMTMLDEEQAMHIADSLAQKYKVRRENIITFYPRSLVKFLDIK